MLVALRAAALLADARCLDRQFPSHVTVAGNFDPNVVSLCETCGLEGVDIDGCTPEAL